MTNVPVWKMTASERETYKHAKADLVMEALRRGMTARVIADMWTAVAEGRLKPADIANQVRVFISAHRKMYQTTDKWGAMSLDAKVFDDSSMTVIDTIRDDQAMWR